MTGCDLECKLLKSRCISWYQEQYNKPCMISIGNLSELVKDTVDGKKFVEEIKQKYTRMPNATRCAGGPAMYLKNKIDNKNNMLSLDKNDIKKLLFLILI